MQAQGQSLVNTAYVDHLVAEIDAITICGDLQILVNEAMASIQSEINGIEQQLAKLLPLTTVPTTLAGVIGWINSLAAPYIQAYSNHQATLTQTLAQAARIATAIEAAAARLTSCQITVPAIALGNPASSTPS